MNLTIQIPNNNIPERTYAVRILFQHFLGLDVEIQSMEITKTIVSWSNKQIVFDDCLWSHNDCLEYLNEENLPKVFYDTNKFVLEKDIPVIYGTSKLDCQADSIYCGIDVFASIFFMLTRWEEYIVKERDEYKRFIGKNSIAFKHGFLNRPVVNEYVEFVWNMLTSLGFEGPRKKRLFQIVLTHDVDDPFMRLRIARVSKYIFQSVCKLQFQEALGYLPDLSKDPYNSYDFLMDISESLNIKSHFYFMSSHWHIMERKKSPYLTRRLKSVVSRIEDRGHIIGFHPGYFSVDSLENWIEEKEWAESFLQRQLKEGRQHYLRFIMPETFSFWERNSMDIDSSLSYHDEDGFRCGTGDIYPVFNFLTRNCYHLCERPLILMDATVSSYKHCSMNEIVRIMNYYLSIGKRYQMPITFLFHNSSFLGTKGRELKKIYESVLRGNVYNK